MEPKMMYAEVYFDHGSHGFSETYNENWTIDQYVDYLTTETRRQNKTKSAIVHYIKVTTHDEDGNVLHDENGNRIMETIYQNTGIKF
jgi:hypothetical protein